MPTLPSSQNQDCRHSSKRSSGTLLKYLHITNVCWQHFSSVKARSIHSFSRSRISSWTVSAQLHIKALFTSIFILATLKSEYRSAYETYVKHYPLAESHHRNQLKQNRTYESFVQSVNYDPRIRKRDLITFLSRPVTRLPRLNLLLEQILKLTDIEHEHPDGDILPIILGILKDLIKSTQPGIEAAEGKVKFWALCESLVFQRGEIIVWVYPDF